MFGTMTSSWTVRSWSWPWLWKGCVAVFHSFIALPQICSVQAVLDSNLVLGLQHTTLCHCCLCKDRGGVSCAGWSCRALRWIFSWVRRWYKNTPTSQLRHR